MADYKIITHAGDPQNYQNVWATDISRKIYRKHTSMYTAAQIADFLGFSELYFIGCDLYPEFKPFPYLIFESASDPYQYIHFDKREEEMSKLDFIMDSGKPVRSFINGIAYKLLKSKILMNLLYNIYTVVGDSMDSHFTSDYISSPRITIGGKNPALIKMHKAIKNVGDIRGFNTYNATLGGKLEVHPRVDLGDVIEESH